MTDVALAPSWQRGRPPRRLAVLALSVALVVLAFAAGPRLIVDYRDLNCPEGYVARPVSIAYWAVQCEPDRGAVSGPRSVAISREVGLFMTNANVRVFDVDFIAGNVLGPAVNVPIR